jgi:DNA-binding CsgD family transcriptional regulator
MTAEAYFILCDKTLGNPKFEEIIDWQKYLVSSIGKGLWQYVHPWMCSTKTESIKKRAGKSIPKIDLLTTDVPVNDIPEYDLKDMIEHILTTKLERKIYEMVTMGITDEEIARSLNRTSRIVKDIRNRIRQKLEDYIRKNK